MKIGGSLIIIANMLCVPAMITPWWWLALPGVLFLYLGFMILLIA